MEGFSAGSRKLRKKNPEQEPSLTGVGVQGFEFWIWGLGFRSYRVQGVTGDGVQGLGFRSLQGSCKGSFLEGLEGCGVWAGLRVPLKGTKGL